jgi:hypothetical protein
MTLILRLVRSVFARLVLWSVTLTMPVLGVRRRIGMLLFIAGKQMRRGR